MQTKLSSVICVIAVAAILFAGKSSADDHCSDDCRPSFLVDPPSTTEWEAEMEAKCFTACVDLVSACVFGSCFKPRVHPLVHLAFKASTCKEKPLTKL